MYDKLITAQDEALEELKAESDYLYKEALKVWFCLYDTLCDFFKLGLFCSYETLTSFIMKFPPISGSSNNEMAASGLIKDWVGC